MNWYRLPPYVAHRYLVGTIYHYESPLAGAKFMGQRQEDQTYYKYFVLRMTKAGRPNNRRRATVQPRPCTQYPCPMCTQ